MNALSELGLVKADYGSGLAARKLALLARMRTSQLASAAQVLRLHEALCFLRAYPDDMEVHAEVARQLEAFARRADLRRHRRELRDSGIAGTAIAYRFFAPTAFWLCRQHPEHVSIDWAAFGNRDRLAAFLPFVATAAETAAIDELAISVRDWCRRMRGPHETDACFLTRSFQALPIPERLREALWDDLDPALLLAAADETPSRTRARYAHSRVVPKQGLRRERPSLPGDVRRPPRQLLRQSVAEARTLIDLARVAMVTRQRDLDAFSSGSPDDVWLADCAGGLEFALIGVRPDRRWLLEAQYGFLALQSGVPIGYGSLSALYGSCAVAYNVFDTFRGGEAAYAFGRLLAVAHRFLGASTFMISSYQIGDDNPEAIRSGAFWFYQKLGFQPWDARARADVDAERARISARPGYRSSAATLRRLARTDLYLTLGAALREDVLGRLPLAAASLATVPGVSERHGSDRAHAERRDASAAARLLRVPASRLRSLATSERIAFQRWAPLILSLPGLSKWPMADRRALFEVARAKGGASERDFVQRFDAHRRVREAIRELATAEV